MPIKEAAKKALRQNKKRRSRNLKRKKAIRGSRQRLEKLLEQGKKEEARQEFSVFQKAVDKAAKTNIIHKNKAARLKSQMAEKIKE